MTGILYIAATPIGNLEDITLRAIRVLREVDIILAEDTRVTKKLLDHLSTDYDTYDKKLISYHHYSTKKKKLEILNWLNQDKSVALVTDAGTPGVSDPGNELIDFVLENNPRIKIVPLPGPSSLTAALSVCGFNVNRFIFAGFLPKKGKNKIFTQALESKLPLLFFDSPKRITKTLERLEEFFGPEKRIFIGRELTKKFETLYRGDIKDIKRDFKDMNIKGEIVVVVEIN